MRKAIWHNRLNCFCLCKSRQLPLPLPLPAHIPALVYNAMFVPLTATFSLFEKAQNRIAIAEYMCLYLCRMYALLQWCYFTMILIVSWLHSLCICRGCPAFIFICIHTCICISCLCLCACVLTLSLDLCFSRFQKFYAFPIPFDHEI